MPIGKVRPPIWFPVVLLLFATASPPAARSTLTVCASGCAFNNLQSALNAASSGDTIVLAAGETYVGNWELPATRHATPVKVTSSASCPDRRIGPQDLHLLPILQARSTDTPAMSGWGASGWEFECVRFEPSDGGAHNVIQLVNVPLGGGSFVNTDNVVFDRIYVAPTQANVRKGIHADGGNIVVTRSHIANVRQPGVETKAFLMQEGPGPVTLTDNYLEAASINIMFGGGDTSSSAHVPNNILIENNHLAKRPEWGNGQYLVKNLIELKTATDVRVRNNLMESSWFGGGEVGLLLQPVNDTANSPWNRIADVLIEGNTIRGVSRGIDILGYEWQACCNSGQTARITVVDNLFVTMYRFFYAAGEIDDVTIDHNTIDNNGPNGDAPGPAAYIDAGDVSTPTEHRAGLYGIDHFVFTNNLMKRGQHGWLTLNHAEGQVTSMLEKATRSYVWTNNVIAGAAGDTYPNCGGGFDCFPTVAAHNAQFNADYTLISGSRYRGAGSDGTNLGWRPAGQSGGPGSGQDGGGSGGTTGPFNGSPAALPGVLQAEDFDRGGQWVSYFDSDSGNAGGAYRTGEDVDIASTVDTGGGYVIGWASAGEWMNYSASVATSGTYDIKVRVGHLARGGTFHIEVNGGDVTGPLRVPSTGGWDAWTTVTASGVWLNAGSQTWRLVLDSNGDMGVTGNFNWIAVAPPSAIPLPFGGSSRALPGVVQAEDFDLGGAGVGFHDADGGNKGGTYRPSEGVDISSTSDSGGGHVVGWASAGEWLQYSMHVTTAGSYDISIRVAQEGAGGTFHIEANGADITGPLTVPATGGWDTWTTVTKSGVWLTAGPQTWRLVLDSNGHAGATGNFNWIAVSPPSSTTWPFAGTSANLPGILEAENFDRGGQRAAYLDWDAGNNGWAYRETEDVDISATNDTGGGYVVGWTTAGEWLTYTVNVSATASYDIGVRLAQEGHGGTFHIEVNGLDVTGPISVPSTGGWDTWTTVTIPGIWLTSGQQVWRVVMDSNGYADATGNFNWISVTRRTD